MSGIIQPHAGTGGAGIILPCPAPLLLPRPCQGRPCPSTHGPPLQGKARPPPRRPDARRRVPPGRCGRPSSPAAATAVLAERLHCVDFAAPSRGHAHAQARVPPVEHVLAVPSRLVIHDRRKARAVLRRRPPPARKAILSMIHTRPAGGHLCSYPARTARRVQLIPPGPLCAKYPRAAMSAACSCAIESSSLSRLTGLRPAAPRSAFVALCMPCTTLSAPVPLRWRQQ